MPSRSTRKIQIGLIQSTCVDDIPANVENAVGEIRTLAKAGANVICLQELFPGIYPCQAEDHDRFSDAEPIPGPTSKTLHQLSKELGVVIVGSLFERRAPGLYHNTAVVFDADGTDLGMYRKMHIPDDPLYYEKFYFTPGDLGFKSFPTKYGRVGVCVCWDQWFPEAARMTALTGAEILFYPTAIGWHPSEKEEFGVAQHSAWETMMRSHAIANGVYVAAPNRVGREGEIEFWGASFVCDPYGTILKRASHEQPENLLVECDLDLLNTARTHWPFFRDRRIDAYQGLTRRFIDGE